jgi:hypothetical protein
MEVASTGKGRKEMSLWFLTGNADKVREIQALIPEIQALNLDLPEIQELDPQQIIVFCRDHGHAQRRARKAWPA